jgi:hypothetical protein
MWNQGQSVDKCIEMVLQLAGATFEGDKTGSIPVISWMLKMGKCYARDGRYPPENLETVLQTLFGKDRTMLDCSYATELGAKLLVLVATVLKNPTCRSFTNYNKPSPDSIRYK